MSRSNELFDAAKTVIPGGVNSPVRAFGPVGGHPPFIARGEGDYIIDADGNRYLDFVCSWGALLNGHAHPAVSAAVVDAMHKGSSFGAPTEAEVKLAEEIVARMPSVERVRLCSSGTEATMHAIRLARGFTGRDLVIKFDGCYHGAHDSMLVSAGSGVATLAIPGSPGVPDAVANLTLVAPFNDLDAVKAMFAEHGSNIAAVILEPVAGNMGCIAGSSEFLQGLRDLTSENGSLLIFDEVMCGFRCDRGSAQGLFGIDPDLTCMGKVVGGGLPLAAFGGRSDIMGHLAPEGPVYQAGTLSGNPLAVAAGLASLQLLDDAFYDRLEQIGSRIDRGLAAHIEKHGLSYFRVGGMFTVFFRSQIPHDFADMKECDTEAFARFHRAALEHGLYLPPSQFEAVFFSGTLTDEQVDDAIKALQMAIEAAVG